MSLLSIPRLSSVYIDLTPILSSTFCFLLNVVPLSILNMNHFFLEFWRGLEEEGAFRWLLVVLGRGGDKGQH